MPLSEGEQRRLDEIEHALRTDDPKFAATITIEHLRRQHVVIAGALFVLGMIALVTGLVVADAALWVGVIITVAGVAAMVGGVVVYFRPGRG
jgi:uncharacterized membrane-anchored protein